MCIVWKFCERPLKSEQTTVDERDRGWRESVIMHRHVKSLHPWLSLSHLHTPLLQKVERFHCRCSSPNTRKRETQTPKIVKLAVAGVTRILRFFTPVPDDRDRLKLGNDREEDETKVSNLDDILMIIRADYENAYFVTGLFTSAIYADDCIFEDPTIKFQGKDLYLRNLKLLVPFFDSPSIELKKIEKGVSPESIIALWKLRTYLKLPWRPLISVEGSTVYELDENLEIVRHVESWNISALEALGQIFTPSFLEIK